MLLAYGDLNLPTNVPANQYILQGYSLTFPIRTRMLHDIVMMFGPKVVKEVLELVDGRGQDNVIRQGIPIVY